MRLIDADILLDRVEWANTNPLLDHGETAVELIKNAPTIEPEDRCSECDAWNQYKNYSRKSQWIPCNWHTKEENLPQECKSVLICMKDSYSYRIGVSYRTDYNRWEGFGRVNVIAWMPLPWIPLPEEASDASGTILRYYKNKGDDD